MIEYIREVDSIKGSKEQENNILQYKKVPGVWILLGKEEGNNSLVCLQVAKTVNIGDEIARDISYLKLENYEPVSKSDNLDPEKKYINQFGEYKFSYKIYQDRAKELYKDIAEKYEDLTFICVAHGEELKDDRLRKDIEKYVAYKTLCRYWVNGRPYKKGKSKEEINIIKKACKDECTSLLEKIRNKYHDKTDSLDEFLNGLFPEK